MTGLELHFSAIRYDIMFNPLYLLGPPILVLVSIPLAIFAFFTTSIALSTLLIRVSIVYVELGIALIRSWLFVQDPNKTCSKSIAPSSSSRRTSPHRRNRRSSGASTSSSQDLAISRKPPTKSGSFASLIGSGGPNRDFEGVGGWRVPGEEEEEALWIGMNSRLELPAAVPTHQHQRKHQRSLTGGSQRWSWSPEAIRMSPMQSRARTPVAGAEPLNPEEYFDFDPHNRFSTASDPIGKHTHDGRRKSLSASSTSSASSRRASAIASTKHAGE
ncbi:hypothetical protein K432DRAFT_219636 [Lepidopterella palustris CBS 459.81]|uniref:Uncharacterized protein n=1 Tax=Lepidopterella palustris CBS 459.81 TaxID=1314670 RepID=A0A8E2JH73_9PEZI|nr:hypothetical protein K432DRAFT_219636 [Lepidopterella palustris CBS 459.81]